MHTLPFIFVSLSPFWESVDYFYDLVKCLRSYPAQYTFSCVDENPFMDHKIHLWVIAKHVFERNEMQSKQMDWNRTDQIRSEQNRIE